MAKSRGIIGVDHVAVFTPRIEEAERFYRDLFGAEVLFRSARHKREWVGIDADATWAEIRRRGIEVGVAFLRAGGLTVAVADEPAPGKGGPLNHVGVGCSEPEFRRIRDRARELGLRVPEDTPESFKFHDPFGVLWEVSRGMEIEPPRRRLDLGSGRVS
jgi:catechol 2,3-dioxygenase-like lactoylglutathione lyase family enzyme